MPCADLKWSPKSFVFLFRRMKLCLKYIIKQKNDVCFLICCVLAPDFRFQADLSLEGFPGQSSFFVFLNVRRMKIDIHSTAQWKWFQVIFASFCGVYFQVSEYASKLLLSCCPMSVCLPSACSKSSFLYSCC